MSLVMEYENAFKHLMRSWANLRDALEEYQSKANYNPSQPRAPRGHPEGGRWVTTVPESWGDKDIKKFKSHYDRHSKDFGIKSPAMYAKRAQEFYQRALHERFPMIRTHAGYLKIYDPKTNRFGVFNPQGKTETFFKPKPKNYFVREIEKELAKGGRLVNPLPAKPASSKPGRGGRGGGGRGGGGTGGGFGGFGSSNPLLDDPWDLLN